MKVRFACLSVGLALAAAVETASAADWNNGAESIKDMSGTAGVPVPAPVPVPDYAAEWYIGVVTGGVLVDDSTISEIGTGMPVRSSDKLAKTMFGGISAGRYITPNLRAELAFDFYDDFKVAGPAQVNYVMDVVSNATGDTVHYDVQRTDRVKVGRTTGMLNLFYDIPLSERFKPYVGGGVGVSWRQMTRNYTLEGDCAGINAAVNCAGIPSDLKAHITDKNSLDTDRFDVALAAMAGFSYQLTPSILWDNGYQLLWEANSVQLTAATPCGVSTCDSTVAYGSTLQHQFRTGLRFLID